MIIELYFLLADISSSSIVIRNWGSSSGRRLLSDTVTVGSAALFSNGVSAASGLAALNTAANSGALQASLLPRDLFPYAFFQQLPYVRQNLFLCLILRGAIETPLLLCLTEKAA